MWMHTPVTKTIYQQNYLLKDCVIIKLHHMTKLDNHSFSHVRKSVSDKTITQKYNG